jgi:hypothetical protein
VPCKTNPLGVKGAGEAGAIGSCPAVVNAIIEGLYREYGIGHIDMPATPSGSGWRSRTAAANTACRKIPVSRENVGLPGCEGMPDFGDKLK